ncbi:MAG: hypothetical protein U0J70_11130 [Atopobiaceae bacterium]|jgi:hypothetical protein|nr:hypothetical protein [Atopobiaceae bacterium]
MGLFDGLKAMKDIVSGGIAAAKASSRLEELADQAMEDYDDVLTPEQVKLYKTYQAEKKKLEGIEPGDEWNAQSDKSEKACVEFVSSLFTSTSLPKSYRNNLKQAVEEYARTNDASAIFEKAMMRYAKTDEERAEIKKAIADMKEDE